MQPTSEPSVGHSTNSLNTMYERLHLSDCFLFCVNSAWGKKSFVCLRGKAEIQRLIRGLGGVAVSPALRSVKAAGFRQASAVTIWIFRFVMLVSVSMEGRYCHCQVSVFQWRHTGIRYCSCILSVRCPDMTSLEWHSGHVQQMVGAFDFLAWNFVIFCQFRMKLGPAGYYCGYCARVKKI